jgi:hypothetical protein
MFLNIGKYLGGREHRPIWLPQFFCARQDSGDEKR